MLIPHCSLTQILLVNTCFRPPQGGLMHTLQSSNRGKGRQPLDYIILMRHVDRRYVRNATITWVGFTDVQFPTRVVPNRRKRGNKSIGGDQGGSRAGADILLAAGADETATDNDGKGVRAK